MDGEYQGLGAIGASMQVYFLIFAAYVAIFRIVVSAQQNREEIRSWWHRRRYAHFMRMSRHLRL